RVGARDAQSPIRKNPLGVAQVPDHLFHAPLARGITRISVGFAASGEQNQSLPPLFFQRGENVVALYERNIPVVVILVFDGPGSCHNEGCWRFDMIKHRELQNRRRSSINLRLRAYSLELWN